MANNAEDTIRNARELLSKGEIKQEDYDESEEAMIGKMSIDEHVAWRNAGNLPEQFNLRGPQPHE